MGGWPHDVEVHGAAGSPPVRDPSAFVPPIVRENRGDLVVCRGVAVAAEQRSSRCAVLAVLAPLSALVLCGGGGGRHHNFDTGRGAPTTSDWPRGLAVELLTIARRRRWCYSSISPSQVSFGTSHVRDSSTMAGCRTLFARISPSQVSSGLPMSGIRLCSGLVGKHRSVPSRSPRLGSVVLTRVWRVQKVLGCRNRLFALGAQ